MKKLLTIIAATLSMHAQAAPACQPKEAGGTGVAYRVGASPEGRYYTWWCPKDTGFVPEWIGDLGLGSPPIEDKTPAQLHASLLKLLPAHEGQSYSRSYLAQDAFMQLNRTKP